VSILLEGVVEEVLGSTVTIIDRPGTLLGPERVIGDEPAVGTLRAVTRATLLLIAPDQFYAAIDEPVGAWVLAHLEARVRSARTVLLAELGDLAGPGAA
jgi:hypothetical protein